MELLYGVGVINIMHIVILHPAEQNPEYINQGIMDHGGSSLMPTGCPGNVNKTRVFWNSSLFPLMTWGVVPCGTSSTELEGMTISLLLFGDLAYLLLP